MKKFLNKTLWWFLSSFFAIMLVILFVGNSFLKEYETQINYALHIDPYKTITSENTDTEYFKSPFKKEDGKYDDIAMRKNSMQISQEANSEASVLLWNKNNSLPLKQSTKISFFGVQSNEKNYLYTGNGSGRVAVTPTDFANLKDTFEKENKFQVNKTLWNFYQNKTGSSMYNPSVGPDGKQDNHYKEFNVNEVNWSEINTTEIASSINEYNTAIMVISRNGSEDGDTWFNTSECLDNNYLDLSFNEKSILDNLDSMREQGKLDNLVLLLNTGTPMQMKNISKYTHIDSCLWVGMGGNASFNGIYDVVSGKVNPSGRLVDTYLYDNDSAPSVENTGAYQFAKYGALPQESRSSNAYNHAYIVYQEGIYVGYRYFETRYEDTVLNLGNANSASGIKNSSMNWDYNKEVYYPFGYGLSYTNFEYSDYNVSKNGDNYKVSLKVTNTGSVAGKDVVQIYLQKPYTEYDKQNKIEKASVELVGYAKTGLLEPNKSEKVEIDVSEYEFKSYDSYNKKTYILEKGDYYLAFGKNAHDALNNILAEKGKNTSSGMDYDGNKNFARKFNYRNDDFVKYSKSKNNVEVTNQFDNADLNLYEGTADQKITYLSRNNWKDTYPKKVELNALNSIMVKDMQYSHGIEIDENAKMPKYRTVTSPIGELTLAMLMDKKYDDPLWEDLLNQMSFKETTELCGVGSHIINGVTSISSPSVIAHDGPAGVKTDTPKSTRGGDVDTFMAFPSGINLASTWNNELVRKVCNAFGLEMMHAKVGEIYGTGAGIHRSTYGGRNWEYFSEDSFLSGRILNYEVIGLQEKGAIVNIKHLVLNDQEIYRCGGTTWANEQSIREIYLKAFEEAVVDGKANGVMSSLNRIGCIWAGKHKGLLTNVLRKEWGFIGFVETDSATGTYMREGDTRAEAILAGNDLWLRGSNNIKELWGDYRNNPTVCQALRVSAKNILYVVAHSMAMNGIDSSTKIIEITPWYFNVMLGAEITVGIITGVCVTLLVLSYVIRMKKKGNKKMNNNEDNNINFETKKEKKPSISPQKKKQLIIFGAAIVVVSATIGIVAGVLTNKKDDNRTSSGNNPVSSETSKPTSSSQEEIQYFDYIVEAEHMNVINPKGSKITQKAHQCSNDNMIDHINLAESYRIDFYSEKNAPGEFYISLPSSADVVVKDNIKEIKINGKAIDIDKEATCKIQTKWYKATSEHIATVNFTKGINVIEIVPFETSEVNFDYFELLDVQGELKEVNKYEAEDYFTTTEEFAEKTYGRECGAASNGKWVNASQNAIFNFKFNSDKAAKADLYASMTFGAKSLLWSELFESITVNGKVYTFGAEEGQFTDSSISSPHWYTNSAFKMGTIDLVSGENTITMKPMTSANFNFDFIDLLTDAVTKAL